MCVFSVLLLLFCFICTFSRSCFITNLAHLYSSNVYCVRTYSRHFYDHNCLLLLLIIIVVVQSFCVEIHTHKMNGRAVKATNKCACIPIWIVFFALGSKNHYWIVLNDRNVKCVVNDFI